MKWQNCQPENHKRIGILEPNSLQKHKKQDANFHVFGYVKTSDRYYTKMQKLFPKNVCYFLVVPET